MESGGSRRACDCDLCEAPPADQPVLRAESFAAETKAAGSYITLGQSSIVRLERDSQLLRARMYDYRYAGERVLLRQSPTILAACAAASTFPAGEL